MAGLSISGAGVVWRGVVEPWAVYAAGRAAGPADASGLSDVPILPNTAFEHEPVLCRPVEAIERFLRMSMDVLVLGGHVVARAPGPV